MHASQVPYYQAIPSGPNIASTLAQVLYLWREAHSQPEYHTGADMETCVYVLQGLDISLEKSVPVALLVPHLWSSRCNYP